MDEFQKVRNKMAEDLTDSEVKLIVDNQDKLNQEEKDAFSELIQQATPLPEDPLNTALDDATKPDDTKQTELVTPEDPVKPALPDPAPALPENVITQDKLDTYIEGKRKEWEAEGKTAAEQAKEEKKIQTFFEEGYKPNDWNDYTNNMLEKVAPIIEQRILAKLDKQNAEITKNQAELRQTQQQIFDRFEAEFATLSKNKLIPDKTESPEEYAKVHAAIIKIGDENGKANITDAYKLWSIIPLEHGGGLQTNGVQDPAKAKIEAQKDAAGKIGSGRGAPGNSKSGPPAYNTIHNARTEDLVDDWLAKH